MNTYIYIYSQLVNGKIDIAVEQIIDIGYSFGDLSKTLYYVEVYFMENKAQLKPTYLNIVNPFDMYSWFGIFISFILVSSCHVIIRCCKKQEVKVVSL